jgi:hypothetical protein
MIISQADALEWAASYTGDKYHALACNATIAPARIRAPAFACAVCGCGV